MSFVKCNACPSPAWCAGEGACLNTRQILAQQQAVVLLNKDGTQAGVAVPEPWRPAQTPTPAPAQAQATRQPRAEGVATRPAAGTTTGRVWAIADQQLAQWPHNPNKEFRRNVINACEAAGINSSTASVQYGKWLSSRT